MKIRNLSIVKTFAWALGAICTTGGALANAAPEPEYEASRFPGVKVRHVPQAQEASAARTTAQVGGQHRGLAVRNVRRIPNTARGYMADVDQATLPHSTASKTASGQVRIKCLEPGDHANHKHSHPHAKAAKSSIAKPKAGKSKTASSATSKR
jgi:hypothetical protein